jgi:hypothetical protein
VTSDDYFAEGNPGIVPAEKKSKKKLFDCFTVPAPESTMNNISYPVRHGRYVTSWFPGRPEERSRLNQEMKKLHNKSGAIFRAKLNRYDRLEIIRLELEYRRMIRTFSGKRDQYPDVSLQREKEAARLAPLLADTSELEAERKQLRAALRKKRRALQRR